MTGASEPPRTDDRRNVLWVLLPALGSLVLATTGLFEGVAKLGSILGLPTRPLAYLSAAALGALSFQFLRQYRKSNSSRLRHPERMRAFLQPSSPDDLVGREQAVEHLKQDCDDRDVVFLFAPSGTGKSMLLRFGLTPKLNQSRELLPVYIATLGPDWDGSEQHRLLAALQEALHARNLPASFDQESRLETVVQQLPDCPLFIFDQIDHYITKHQARLVRNAGSRLATAGTTRWLSASELEASNSFWQSVATLVRGGKAKILFACENEFASASGPFRFTEPATVNLERLPETAVQELLVRLERDAEGPMIDAPDNGWIELRTQLVNDISDHSLIVPMQLRIALERLPTLQALTTAAYYRRGGLAGLVGNYVTEQISAASEKASISLDDATRIMRSFLDEGSRRAISLTERELCRALTMSSSSLGAALKELSRQGGLLRAAVDAGCGEITYRLRHDYLIQPVVESLRQFMRDPELLNASHRAFSGSRWLGRWSTLLPLSIILRLVRGRLHGNVRFRMHRVYMGLSVARVFATGLLPLVTYVALADLGASLPGRDTLQRWLDMGELSLARRPADARDISQRANALRDTLGRKILTRQSRTHPGWIFGLENVFVDPDPWTHAQALTALLEGFGDAGPVLPGLDVLTALPAVSLGGRDYGWKIGGAAVAVESAAWVALAALANERRQTARIESPSDSRARVVQLWQVLENYRRDGENGGQGYAHFPPDPLQSGSGDLPSVHGSVLVLNVLLEAQHQGIDLSNSRERIRALLRFFASQRIAPHTGLWRQGDVDCQPCEGLSFQIQSTVLGGVLSGSISPRDELAAGILDGIPEELATLSRMPANYPLCSGRTLGMSGGQPVTTSLYFMWFAWGLSLSGRYLQYATDRSDTAGQLLARRALTHLVLDLGEAMVARYGREYTYRQAETLLGLAHVERALQATARRPAQ